MARGTSLFLANPTVEIIRDRGRNAALFVRLQRGKYSYTVSPDPESLVYLLVDGRGLPVILDFLERRDPLLVLRDVLDLVARAPGADERVRRRFRDPAYVGRLLEAIRRGVRRLPAVPAFVAAEIARRRRGGRASYVRPSAAASRRAASRRATGRRTATLR
jgi:hypothetical protein